MVLLHGGSAHAHWWDFFAPAIAEHYRVVALDLRGHGDSEHPEPPAYGLENYVDDLGAFIEASSLQHVTLIGHSLGGMIATAYSAALPQRVHSLVVVDSSLKMTAAGAAHGLSGLWCKEMRTMGRGQRYRCTSDTMAPAHHH